MVLDWISAISAIHNAKVIEDTLDPKYFNALLDSLRYAPDMWTSLAHGDAPLAFAAPVPYRSMVSASIAGDTIETPCIAFP